MRSIEASTGLPYLLNHAPLLTTELLRANRVLFHHWRRGRGLPLLLLTALLAILNEVLHPLLQLALEVSLLVKQTHVHTPPIRHLLLHNSHQVQLNLLLSVKLLRLLTIRRVVENQIQCVEILIVFLLRSFLLYHNLLNLLLCVLLRSFRVLYFIEKKIN